MEMRNPVMLILQDRRLFLQTALASNQRFVGCDDIFPGKCQNISSRPAFCHVSEHIHKDIVDGASLFFKVIYIHKSFEHLYFDASLDISRYFNLLGKYDGQSLLLKN